MCFIAVKKKYPGLGPSLWGEGGSAWYNCNVLAEYASLLDYSGFLEGQRM